MNITLDTSGMPGLSRMIERQARYAVAVALTRTAQDVRAAIPAALDQVFEWADQALREGMLIQREHARRIAEHGQARADAWLHAQRPQAPAITLREGKTTVGLLGGRRAI